MQVTHFTEANDEMGETEEINDKHRWDAKDLEKVTQFTEESDEMGEVSKESLGNLKVQPESNANKIIIRKEDIQLIMDELGVPKYVAERKLVENAGDLKIAIRDMIESET